MKKFFLSIIISLTLPVCLLNAQNSKSITITFNENDFSYSYNDYDELTINYGTQLAIFKENTSAPCLPFIPINVLVPSGSKFSDVVSIENKKLLKENVNLTQNPTPIPTDSIVSNSQLRALQYKEPVYPTKSVEYTFTNIMDGYTIMSFLLCPFEYDSKNKKLYFISSFDLEIRFEQTSANRATAITQTKGIMTDVVKSIIINKEDLNENNNYSIKAANTVETIDYLIITNLSLSSYFKPLTSWKKTKGLNPKVITTEYISQNYVGESMPVKIKSCLYDYYKNHNLKYVLLGGDDTIVPTMGCYVFVDDDNKYDNMPTDLFYACFDGDFEWNQNGNNLIGEETDNVNLTPSISVTRIPVRTPNHLVGFINKLLYYEKNPTLNGWNNSMLTTGAKLYIYDKNNPKKSDSEIRGDNLYSTYIAPYWDGARKKFYDTGTDFDGGANFPLNTENLHAQLNQGYAFVEMITHGAPTNWTLETGLYTTNEANSLSARQATTIITTNSCLTNAFDEGDIPGKADPCLSESFIRNPNSGVVAYLGCSREGWTSLRLDELGTSMQYEAQFYKNLFSSDIVNKNFGTIVAAAKAAMIGTSSTNGSHRWVQFGLNPIGDPEMPIYTTTPHRFTNVTITQDENKITVNTGLPGCSICLMSINDTGETYHEVRNNVQNAVFNGVDTEVSVCVTKQNYIPFVKEVDNKNLYLQNENITGPKSYEYNVVKIGSSVTSTKPNGEVNFNGGDINIKANKIVIDNGTSISTNTNFKMSNK